MGDPEYGSKLLNRQHYPALWQQAVSLKEQGIRRLVVRGSPGIGKSWWLFVVLREAARLCLTVVLQHAKLDSRFLFNGSTVLEGDRKQQPSSRRSCSSRDTLYLVDGEQPTLARAWTIAAVSPLREHYWSYHKEPGTRVLFMPVWSEEELLEAQRLVYPHLEEELVKQLYEKWGGSARYCLQWATDKAAQLELQQALDETDLGACVKAVGNLDSASAASNRILHFSVSDDYASATVVFASRYAERLLMNSLLKRGRAQLRQELASRLGERAYASFVGAAFEEIFHNMMETGCELMCRDLEAEDAAPQLLQFGACQTHIFLDKEDVSRVQTAHYFIPVGKTFEAVDSILQPDSVFQVTTAADHKVSGKGLENALQLLPEKDSYKLYFVVPDHRFESFKKQQVKTTLGHGRQSC